MEEPKLVNFPNLLSEVLWAVKLAQKTGSLNPGATCRSRGWLEDASVHGADFVSGLYQRQEAEAKVMGDLVLMQDEVNPV